MPCADCLEQQKILIRLTSALHDRELQNQEVTKKFQKYKLQTKAKFAQLRHQILDASSAEDAATISRLNNLLLRLDEVNDQLLQYRDQIDDLKTQLCDKNKELDAQKVQIRELEDDLKTKGTNEKAQLVISQSLKPEISSSEDGQQQDVQQMYAQVVYKEAKILELSKIIDEKDKTIMDWQEASKERDEVNKAKTKAIQILQEHLNRYISKKKCDRSTETENNLPTAVERTNFEDSVLSPGGAVPFYKDNVAKDDECSSFTTDVAATDISFDVTDFVQNPISKDNKSIDKLNCRLSGLLHQVESMQRRVVKQDLELLEQSAPQQQQLQQNSQSLLKKKRQKKVKFDFTEQDRLAQISELEEKLQKIELERTDFLQENDDLRSTISDLEQRLDECLSKNDYFEKYTQELENRLENAERDAEDSRQQLEDAIKEHKNASLKAKASLTTKIKDLEDDLKRVNDILDEKSHLLTESEKNCSNLTADLRLSQIAIARLKEENKKLEADLAAKSENLRVLAEKYENTRQDLKECENDFDLYKENMERLLIETEQQTSSRLKQYQDEFALEKAKLIEEIEHLDAQLDELKQKITELTFNLRTVSAERDKLNEQKEIMFKDLDQLKEAIEVSNEFIDFLESDLNLSYLESEELRRQIETTELLREASEYRLKFKAYITKMRVLQKDNETLAEELAKCVENLEKALKDKYALTEELENLKRQRSVDRQKLEEAQQSCVHVSAVYEKSALDSKDNIFRVKELQETLDEKSVEVQNLNDQLRQREHMLSTSRHQLDTMSSEIEDYRKQIEGLMEEKLEIENELQKLWRADSLAKKTLAEFEGKYELVSAEKLALIQQLDEERRSTADLKRQLETLDALAGENLTLREQLNCLGRTIDQESKTAITELTTCQTNLNAVQNQCETLRRDVEFLRESLSAVWAEKESVERRAVECGGELREAKKFADAKVDELRMLQAEFEGLKNKLDMEKEALRTENETIRRETDTVKESLKLETYKHQAAENELKEQQTLSENLVEQLNLLSDKLKNTESRVEEILLEKQTVEQSNLDLNHQLSLLKSGYVQNYEKLQADYAVLENQAAALNQQLIEFNDVKSRLAGLEAKCDEIASEKQNLELSNFDFCQQLTNLKEQLGRFDQMQQNCEILEKRLESLNSEYFALKMKSEEHELQILVERQEQQRKMDDYIQEIEKLRSELEQKNVATAISHDGSVENEKLSAVNRMECELKNLNERLAEQDATLKREREEHEMLIETYGESIKKLQMELSEKRSDFGRGVDTEKLEKELEENEERVWDLEEQLRTEREHYKMLIEEHTAAQAELTEFADDLQKELNQQKAKYEKVSGENEQLLAKLQDLQNQFDAVHGEIDGKDADHLRLMYEKLLDEKNGLSEERHTLCSEIIDLNDRLSNLQTECEIQKTFAERLADNLVSLSQENEALNMNGIGSRDVIEVSRDVSDVTRDASKQADSKSTDWELAYNQLAVYYTQLQDAYSALYAQLQIKNENTTGDKVISHTASSLYSVDLQPHLSSSSVINVDGNNMQIMPGDNEQLRNDDIVNIDEQQQSFFIDNLDDISIDAEFNKSSNSEEKIKAVFIQEEKLAAQANGREKSGKKMEKNANKYLQAKSQAFEKTWNDELDRLSKILESCYSPSENWSAVKFDIQAHTETALGMDSSGGKFEEMKRMKSALQSAIFSDYMPESVKSLLQYLYCLFSEMCAYKLEAEKNQQKSNEAVQKLNLLERKYVEIENIEKLNEEEVHNLKQMCLNMDHEKNDALSKLKEAQENVHALTTDCDKFQDSSLNAESLLKESRIKLETVTKENEDIKITLQSYEHEITKFKSELKSIQEAKESSDSEYANFKECIRTLYLQLLSVSEEKPEIHSEQLDSIRDVPSFSEFERLLINVTNRNEQDVKLWREKYTETAAKLNGANEALRRLHVETENLHKLVENLYDNYKRMSSNYAKASNNVEMDDEETFLTIEEKLTNLDFALERCFSSIKAADEEKTDSLTALRKQLEHIEAILNQKNEEQSRMQLESDHLNELLASAREELEKLTMKCSLIEDEYQKVQSQLETCKKHAKSAFISVIKSQENFLELFNTNHNRMDTSLNSLEQKLKHLEDLIFTKIMEKGKVCANLSKLNETLHQEITKLRLDYEENVQQLKFAVENVTKSREHSQNVEFDLNSLNEKYTQLLDEHEILKKSVQATNEEKSLEYDFSVLNEKHAALMECNNALTQAQQTLKSDYDQLSEKLNLEYSKIENLRSKNSHLEDKCANLQADRFQMEQVQTEKEQAYKKQLEENAGLKSTNEGLLEKIHSLRQEKNILYEEKDELLEKHNHLKKAYDEQELQLTFFKEQTKFHETSELVHNSTQIELKKMEHECSLLISKNENLQTSNRDLQTKFNDSQVKLKEYENQLREVRKLNDELQPQQNICADTDELIVCSQEVQCSLDQDENGHLLQKITELESRLQRNKEHVEGVSNLFDESDLLKRFDEENERLKHEVERLTEENNTLTTGTTKVTQEFTRLKDEYKKNVANMKRDIKDMNQENQRLLATNSEKDASCEKFISDIHSLEVKLIEKTKMADNFQKQLENEVNLKNQIQTLENELSTTKKEVINYQKNCRDLKKLIDEMKTEQAGPTGVNAQLKKASQEAKLLVSELEQQRSAHNQYIRQIGELKEQLSHAESQLDACRTKIAKQDARENKQKQFEAELEKLLAEKREMIKLLSKYEKEAYVLKKEQKKIGGSSTGAMDSTHHHTKHNNNNNIYNVVSTTLEDADEIDALKKQNQNSSPLLVTHQEHADSAAKDARQVFRNTQDSHDSGSLLRKLPFEFGGEIGTSASISFPLNPSRFDVFRLRAKRLLCRYVAFRRNLCNLYVLFLIYVLCLHIFLLTGWVGY